MPKFKLHFLAAITKDAPVRNDERPSSYWNSVARLILSCSAALVVLTGCTSVGVHEQRLVSKPGMTFSDSAVYNYSARIFSQVERGVFATSGGAQATGCTGCR